MKKIQKENKVSKGTVRHEHTFLSFSQRLHVKPKVSTLASKRKAVTNTGTGPR